MFNDDRFRITGRRWPVAAAVIAVAVTMGAIYAMVPADRNDQTAGEAANRAAGSGYSTGAVANFVIRRTPEAVADVTFEDGSGAARSLSDWQGRVALVNLWATWCGPCREEMPALDRLQDELGGDAFEVVALSVDRKGREASGAFLEEVGADSLALYVDATGKAMFDLKAQGLPATLLIGRDGRELGRLLGPAEWDAEEAKRLVRAAIAGELPNQGG